MVGNGVELLVVLTGTLLLPLVSGGDGWEDVAETEDRLLRLYEEGWFLPAGENGDVGEPGDYDDYDEDEDDPISEREMREFEDVSPGASFTFDPDQEFHDSLSVFPRSREPSQASTELDVVCTEDGFQISLPEGLKDDWNPFKDAPAHCDLDLLKNILTIPFTGCNVTRHGDDYGLELWYVDEDGKQQKVTAFCYDVNSGRSELGSKCSKPAVTAEPPVAAPTLSQNCAVPTVEQVRCGETGISPSNCQRLGCCVCSSTLSCYYPVDECTADEHFVFSIRHDSASIPVDPTNLKIPGTNCKPVLVNEKVAIFKFKVTECGVRAYTIGETQIYLAEVQTVVKVWNLKYGVISRSDPLRFLIECRYSQSVGQSLASVGYMVKTPSSALPSLVLSHGLYGVELRIAKDETYSTFHSTYHQPLRVLLGKPVYLELRLKSPIPEAVLLVNYCVTYPLSASNALVLVYEGCANPHDPHVSVLHVNDLPNNRHQRRFVVDAFQFMDRKTNKYLDEEIYFMCSSEVCWPSEKTCQERCFDRKDFHLKTR